MPYFVRNADGDEIVFVHEGQGKLETDYGVLGYEPGDYVVIPKGTTYRVHVDATAGPGLFLIIEAPAPSDCRIEVYWASTPCSIPASSPVRS